MRKINPKLKSAAEDRTGKSMGGLVKTLIVGAAIGLSVATSYGVASCVKENRENVVSILKNYRSTDGRHIKMGDTYLSYAKELQTGCSELTEVSARDISEYLQELNDERVLMAGETVIIPDYRVPVEESH